jgi:hypothetical protein
LALAVAAGTYAVVVDGADGSVSEHRLGSQAPGAVLPPTAGLRVWSSRVSAGRRATVLSVPLAALAAQGVGAVSFAAMQATAALPVITAVGRCGSLGWLARLAASLADSLGCLLACLPPFTC